MADKIELEVLTLERPLLRETVTRLSCRKGWRAGHYFGAHADNSASDRVLTTAGHREESVQISGGFAEHFPDRVSVLAEVAKPEE
jgi:F0F1-type ATP synthase epsilon subunit